MDTQAVLPLCYEETPEFTLKKHKILKKRRHIKCLKKVKIIKLETYVTGRAGIEGRETWGNFHWKARMAYFMM